MGEKKYTNPNKILILTAIISIIIAKNLTSDEQEFVGNILDIISENILFIQSLNEKNEENDQSSNGNIKQMQEQIDELKQHIKYLEKRFYK